MPYSYFPIIGAEKELPVYLVTTGLNECEQHIIRKTGFWKPQIIYSTRGSGTLITEGQTYIIEPDTVFFLPAGVPHEYYPNGSVWDTHWVVPDGDGCDRLLKHIGLDGVKVMRLHDTERLEIIFRKMHDVLSLDKLYGNYAAAALLYDFLIELYRITSGPQNDIPQCRIVASAIDYINAHFAEQISLDDISRAAAVSPQHLCRMFRSSMDTTPAEYLVKRRLQASKQLMISSNEPIERIALLCGFSTGNYFSMVFRKYEGITPGSYRKGTYRLNEKK